MPLEITTSDGFTLTSGDRAFNYYDHAAGMIGDIDPHVEDGSHWFDFIQDNGNSKSLNGARICSMEYAERHGWVEPVPAPVDLLAEHEAEQFPGYSESTPAPAVYEEQSEYCCPKHGVHQWSVCGLCEVEPKRLVSVELSAAVEELEDAARKMGEARNWLDRVTRLLPDAPITQGIALDEMTQAGERLDRAIAAYDAAKAVVR